jgi:hypothetical protein
VSISLTFSSVSLPRRAHRELSVLGPAHHPGEALELLRQQKPKGQGDGGGEHQREDDDAPHRAREHLLDLTAQRRLLDGELQHTGVKGAVSGVAAPARHATQRGEHLATSAGAPGPQEGRRREHRLALGHAANALGVGEALVFFFDSARPLHQPRAVDDANVARDLEARPVAAHDGGDAPVRDPSGRARRGALDGAEAGGDEVGEALCLPAALFTHGKIGLPPHQADPHQRDERRGQGDGGEELSADRPHAVGLRGDVWVERGNLTRSLSRFSCVSSR